MSGDLAARLHRLVGRAVTDFRMIRDGDRLLVGVSGGIDSLVLMHLLERFRARAPVRFTVTAATVDGGFSGIDLRPLRDYAAACGWRLEIVSAPIARLLGEKGGNPCGLCSRLRRGLLYRTAHRLGCNVLALGHHRDDLCVSFLMSLLRGGGLKTMGPCVPADGGRLRLIRPLCYAPRALIQAYAQTLFPPACGECDHHERLQRSGDRAWLERLLDDLRRRFPGADAAMLRSLADVRTDHLLDRRFLSLDGETSSP